MSIRRTPTVPALALIAALALSGGLLTACAPGTAASPVAEHSHVHSVDAPPQTVLYSGMRTLWLQHMEWTWATVAAFATESPLLDASMQRLLQNQVHIGDAIAPLYGDDAAGQLTALLTEHIEMAVPVLVAAKAGDEEALNAAVEDWYGNADEIGVFLAAANPAWAEEDMRAMMEMHITTTLGYAGDLLAGDFVAAIAKYDAAEAHMVEMADMLSQGLIAQFPEKF